MNAKEKIDVLTDNIEKVIVGKKETVRLTVASLIAGGHVLLDDVPGTGKTKLARSIARSVNVSFRRIQFTPDLLPSDITGLSVYSPKTGEFEFKPGPVFTHILLADEINRATPRTQAGLLECMEEKQVSLDGVTRPLEEPFFVIATQNPVETSGTFPLPQAQMDRFLMKLSMGFPEKEEEYQILERFAKDEPLETLEPVLTGEDILSLRKEASMVFSSNEMLDYIANIIMATRKNDKILSGCSPRGSLALLRSARALALMAGRNYIVPEDIKELAVPVLAHRLILAHSYAGTAQSQDLIQNILNEVPVPTEKFDTASARQAMF